MLRRIYIMSVALIAATQLFAQQPGGRQNMLTLISETEAGSILRGTPCPRMIIVAELNFGADSGSLVCALICGAATPSGARNA